MEKVLILMALVSAVYSCTVDLPYYARSTNKNELESETTRVHFSQYVVYGIVNKAVRGAKYPYNGMEGMYTVKFKVLCSFKGGPVPETIYIAGMGNNNNAIPGCPVAEPHEHNFQIMFLKNTTRTKSDAIYEIEYAPTGGKREHMIDDLALNCGLELHESTAVEECKEFPPLSEEEGCEMFKKPEPTTTPTAAPTTTPEDKDDIDVKPVTEAEDGDNQSDQGGYNTKNDKPVNNGRKTGTVSHNDTNGSAGGLASSAVLAVVSIFHAILL